MARKLGIATKSVQNYRTRLGIEPYKGRRHQPQPRAGSDAPRSRKGDAAQLLDDHRHLVGVNTDTELAEMLGISFSTVHEYRTERGIARAPHSPRELGKVARAIVLANRALLGKTPDDDVAARLGVHPSLILRVRKELGIAASREWRSRGAPRSAPVRDLLDAHREILGITTDRDIAERLGCSIESVRQFRLTEGISKVVASATPAPPVVVQHAAPAGEPAASDPRFDGLHSRTGGGAT